MGKGVPREDHRHDRRPVAASQADGRSWAALSFSPRSATATPPDNGPQSAPAPPPAARSCRCLQQPEHLAEKCQIDTRSDPRNRAANLNLERRCAGTDTVLHHHRNKVGCWNARVRNRCRTKFPPPVIELIAMQAVPQGNRARHRPWRQALGDDGHLLRHAPAPPSRRPSQYLDPTETVPVNWQITWHTSHCDLPRNAAASPHCRQPAQGEDRALLTVYVWADGVYLQARMKPAAECMLMLIGATPEG